MLNCLHKLYKSLYFIITLILFYFQTAGGYLLFYGLGTGSKNLYEQVDPENPKLRRESDELYLKEPIPDISIQLVMMNYDYILWLMALTVNWRNSIL